MSEFLFRGNNRLIQGHWRLSIPFLVACALISISFNDVSSSAMVSDVIHSLSISSGNQELRLENSMNRLIGGEMPVGLILAVVQAPENRCSPAHHPLVLGSRLSSNVLENNDLPIELVKELPSP